LVSDDNDREEEGEGWLKLPERRLHVDVYHHFDETTMTLLTALVDSLKPAAPQPDHLVLHPETPQQNP